MATVSVLLASYNQVEYLTQAIESVLQQTFEDWELVIVDNGSTDGSQDLLKKYSGHPKIRTLLFSENLPPTQRWNHAISIMQGDFVSILCADDYYLPEKLALQVEQFATQPADCGVIYSPGYRLNDDTKAQWLDPTITASGWILPDLLNGLGRVFIHPVSQLIRRECFKRYPYYEDMFMEGESIFFRFAMSYRFHYHPTPTVVMREHARNMGRSLKRNLPNILTCLERLSGFPELNPSDARLLERVKTRFFRNSAWMTLRVTNDSGWARDMFLRGLSRDWRQGLHPKTIIGLGLTFLPERALANVNALLFRLHPGMHRVDHVT